MGSNPIIGTLDNVILRGKFVRLGDLVDRERSRKKTQKTPPIRQVFVKYLALRSHAAGTAPVPPEEMIFVGYGFL